MHPSQETAAPKAMGLSAKIEIVSKGPQLDRLGNSYMPWMDFRCAAGMHARWKGHIWVCHIQSLSTEIVVGHDMLFQPVPPLLPSIFSCLIYLTCMVDEGKR